MEDADPEFLYNLREGFDEASFEDDLEHFPEYFDENGWPLFGDYDPYALTHPITGLSWHKIPRVPRDNETDPDYDGWYWLLMTYDAAKMRFVKNQKRKPKASKKTSVKRQYSNASGVVLSVRENLEYLRRDVYPYLDKLFEGRSNSPEFLLLWGEFCQIAENIGVSVQRRGKDDKLTGQIKWYLHWRRYCNDVLEVSTIAANKTFVMAAWRIVDSNAPCPPGFDKDWFILALGQTTEGRGKKNKPARQLPDSLKRAYIDRKKADQLLASNPETDPKIPPIDPDFYK